MADIELTLYGRKNCHLCEEMLSDISSLFPGFAFAITYVDIDGDPSLADRFNEIVPVLMHGDHELGRVRANKDSVLAYLKQLA